MAKNKEKSTKEKSTKEKSKFKDVWTVVHYVDDDLASVCHLSEVNEDDERIKKISEHKEIDDAISAQIKYAKSKKITAQY